MPDTRYGEPVIDAAQFVSDFAAGAAHARGKVSSSFKRPMDDPPGIVAALEAIIAEMWAQGWTVDPKYFSVFVRDFGLVLASAIQSTHRCQLVYRSDEVLDHVSLWWPGQKLEAFPFHRIAKSLIAPAPGAIDAFVKTLPRP
jgi:hypothetical protein